MTASTGGAPTTTTFQWDDAGNQTSRNIAGNTYIGAWDAEGELIGMTGPGYTGSNIYDADGNRLIRFVDGVPTVYLPGGQEITATTTKVTATRWYTFGGATVAVRTSTGLSGVSSILTDHHGTPIAHVKNTDRVAPIERIRTDPFGKERAGQPGNVAGRGFLGATVDPIGITLLGARYYDPGTGTFLSVDPLLDPMLPAQYNAYVYSANNPATWSDPSGQAWGHDPDHPVNGGKIRLPTRTKADDGATGASNPEKPVLGRHKPNASEPSPARPAPTNPRFSELELDRFAHLTQLARCSKFPASNLPCDGDRYERDLVSGLTTMSDAIQILPMLRWLRAIRFARADGGVVSQSKPVEVARPAARLDFDRPDNPPGPAWEWRGSGAPGSSRGNWYNSRTSEYLHPDLKHPEPIGPHYDWRSPDGTMFRVFRDGRVEPK